MEWVKNIQVPPHGSLELSQLGKNVSGVWRVLYDARGTSQHHQLREKIYSWEKFEKITIYLFSIFFRILVLMGDPSGVIHIPDVDPIELVVKENTGGTDK